MPSHGEKPSPSYRDAVSSKSSRGATAKVGGRKISPTLMERLDAMKNKAGPPLGVNMVLDYECGRDLDPDVVLSKVISEVEAREGEINQLLTEKEEIESRRRYIDFLLRQKGGKKFNETDVQRQCLLLPGHQQADLLAQAMGSNVFVLKSLLDFRRARNESSHGDQDSWVTLADMEKGLLDLHSDVDLLPASMVRFAQGLRTCIAFYKDSLLGEAVL